MEEFNQKKVSGNTIISASPRFSKSLVLKEQGEFLNNLSRLFPPILFYAVGGDFYIKTSHTQL